jgi:O-antigen/teichoic acid export membrane protein
VKLRRNLLAGLVSSIWSALVGLAVIPFYLKYLGIEAYGLKPIFVTTQAVLSLLDMGMAPTINREVARCSATGSLSEAGKLLHTLAVVYWSMAGIIALLIVLLAPSIAGYWLKSKQLSPQTISHAVMLMGLVVACRWPVGLYQGALIGAQRLTVSSAISITMTTIASLGAVAILAFVSATIEAFFIWQACMGLVYAIVMRWGAWRIIGRMKHLRFDVNALKNVWRFSVGMSGISLTALVFTQLDKILLSKILGLDAFGHYMLATVIVSGIYVLVTPLFNVMYPRFSALVMTGEVEKLALLYRLSTKTLATILLPIAMVLAVFARDLVFVWTGNQDIAMQVAPIISLLAIGSALHGIMYMPYALQLAFGVTKLPLKINSILMIILIPLIVYLALKYGALGGAMAWLILHLLYLLLGSWLTHRILLKGMLFKWLFLDVGIPLILSISAGVVGYYFIQNESYSIWAKLICGAGLALCTSALTILVSPEMRRVTRQF